MLQQAKGWDVSEVDRGMLQRVERRAVGWEMLQRVERRALVWSGMLPHCRRLAME